MRKSALIALGAAAALTLSACSAGEETPVEKVEAGQTAPTPEVAAHGHARGDGTIATIQGVGIDLVESTYAAGEKTTLQFSLTRFDEPIMDYVLKHEYPVHVVIADTELGSYQHLHPTMGTNGVWQLPVTFPAGGKYRLVADFVVLEGNEEVNYVVGTDVQVTGAPAAAFTLPQPASSVTVDGYVVSVSGSVSASSHSMLMFTVTKDGVPVTFEKWLGADGHLVALRQGDLAYAHMHPMGGDHDHANTGAAADADATMGDGAMDGGTMADSMQSSMPGMIHFDAEFPAGAGTYRLFLQFQVDGKLSTAAFTAAVA
jgi:hypothetical protein